MPLLIGGGALNMQALVSGSIQLSQNSASSAIQPALRGAPIVIMAVQESRMPFQIVARPEIKAPEQIDRKKKSAFSVSADRTTPACSGHCAPGRSIRAE